jgi:DNA/RNA-binding domain of Phe-tRNA-synthetase-like protein
MFVYADAITQNHPTIRAGVIHANGLTNDPSSAELIHEYRAEPRTAFERLQATAIADLPSIGAWRRAFSQFGAKPTQYRSAPEALLRRLAKQGEIPSINTLVDVGNLVSVRYAMPVAVFDLANIAGTITVRYATGDELFADLGSSATVSPEPGEVIFVDRNNVVCARRWCWRQSDQSATNPNTVEALIVVEGLHDAAEQDVPVATDDLLSLLSAHQPQARFTSYLLLPDYPSAESAES